MKHYKDINECWQAGVTPEIISQCVNAPEILRPDKLKSINDFAGEIWRKFNPAGVDQTGLTLPWGNHFGSSLPFRFRYGEVTIWTGYNKHGKSEVLNHCMIHLCWLNERVLICSLEVPAPETYRKLIRMTQALSNEQIREEFPEEADFSEKCLEPLAQKVWVYNAVGNADLEDVQNVMLYAYQRFGCRQFVLDSLMRFSGIDGEGQEIWNLQKSFMDRLLTFAQTYNVHIHLVAHSKKPNGGEGNIPRRYDVMGSSYITNLAFNVIVVWRNRAKQDKLEKIFQACDDLWVEKNPGSPKPVWKKLLAGPPDKNAPEAIKVAWRKMCDVLDQLPTDKREEFQKQVALHDAYFIVDAQRGGDGDCPARHLWFHHDSLQFLEVSPWKDGPDPRKKPKRYADIKPAEMDEEL